MNLNQRARFDSIVTRRGSEALAGASDYNAATSCAVI